MAEGVTKEGAFDQLRRHRAAIDGNERLPGTGALALDRTRDQFLADAALAFDQNRDAGPGGAAPERDDTGHGFAAGNQIGEVEFASGGRRHAADLVLERLDPKRIFHRYLETFRAYRGDDEIDGAGAHGGDGRIDFVGRREDDDGRLPRQGPHR